MRALKYNAELNILRTALAEAEKQVAAVSAKLTPEVIKVDIMHCLRLLMILAECHREQQPR